MDYIQTNKAAWEEAFDRRKPRWGEDVPERLLREKLPFLHPDLAAELSQLDLLGKHAAQFCCNNGRELLSLMRLGPASGTGFDLVTISSPKPGTLPKGRASKTANLSP